MQIIIRKKLISFTVYPIPGYPRIPPPPTPPPMKMKIIMDFGSVVAKNTLPPKFGLLMEDFRNFSSDQH